MENEIYDNCKIIYLDKNEQSHRKAFYDINVEWIEEYYIVEDLDKKILSQPEKILENDGFILLAQYQNELIGTIALTKEDDGEYELSKLGVKKQFRGFGISKKLMDVFFKILKDKGLHKLYITTDRLLFPAITIYEKYGFVEVSEDRHSKFERGNITMKCILD